MRILLVTPMPPRADAPSAIPLVLHAMITGLVAHHEVTLVTAVRDERDEAEAAADLAQSGLDIHVVDARTPSSAAARWRRRRRFLGTWARGAYPWRTVWFADPRIQKTIDMLTRARTFDVAAVEDNSMGVFRFPAQLPTVITEHEVRNKRPVDWHLGPPTTWVRRGLAEADWRRWPAYQRTVWSRFDRVQVFTRRDEAAVARIAPELRDRVRVNPFAIDVPEPSDPAREEPGVLLFVGNFAHPPNVDAACWLVDEIMPRLRAANEGAVRLLIVGPGAPPHVRALASRDVEIVGEVPSVAAYLEAASVVLAPVRIGSGMRMKALHALASGKPLVTTSRGAEGLTVAAVDPPLVVADEPDAIASATTELLHNAELRRTIGARGRSFVIDHHSPPVYCRRLEATYEELLRERGNTRFAGSGETRH